MKQSTMLKCELSIKFATVHIQRSVSGFSMLSQDNRQMTVEEFIAESKHAKPHTHPNI